MDRKVEERIARHAEWHANRLMATLSRCESPIEQLFVMGLLKAGFMDAEVRDGRLMPAYDDGHVAAPGDLKGILVDFRTGVFVIQQCDLSEVGLPYRADFTFCASGEKHRRLVVELDGHEFHERTKEQAARDKRRDREVLAAGLQVVRFTGSEIWTRLDECVDEVLSLLAVLCGRDAPAAEGTSP